METKASAPALDMRPAYGAVVAGLTVLAAAVIGLLLYKWSGSLRVLQATSESGVLAKSPDPLLTGGALHATVSYLRIVWPALVFGLLIGAAVRAGVSPRWVTAVLGGQGLRPVIRGGLAGTPLMLCSCCVTPIFSGAYQRGAKLGPSLALMLASPGLNVAALALTFVLLPPHIGVARLVASVVAVFGLSATIGKLFALAVPPGRMPSKNEEDFPRSLRAFAARFVKDLGYLTVVTVPLIVGGVLLSSAVLPGALRLSASGQLLAVALIALAGVLVALPTFFEIPLALVLLQLGAPVGAAVAFLIAGPIVNLPSLLVLGREASPKVALAVGTGVWLISALTGAAFSL